VRIDLFEAEHQVVLQQDKNSAKACPIHAAHILVALHALECHLNVGYCSSVEIFFLGGFLQGIDGAAKF
jgi:hypothetical protein